MDKPPFKPEGRPIKSDAELTLDIQQGIRELLDLMRSEGAYLSPNEMWDVIECLAAFDEIKERFDVLLELMGAHLDRGLKRPDR